MVEPKFFVDILKEDPVLARWVASKTGVKVETICPALKSPGVMTLDAFEEVT